jgi:hypothetical protein
VDKVLLSGEKAVPGDPRVGDSIINLDQGPCFPPFSASLQVDREPGLRCNHPEQAELKLGSRMKNVVTPAPARRRNRLHSSGTDARGSDLL